MNTAGTPGFPPNYAEVTPSDTTVFPPSNIRVAANATITLPLTAVLTTTNDFNRDIQAALESSVFIQVVDEALSLETDITG